MKKQYFGDVRDLFKFDLIEAMLKDAPLNLKRLFYVIMLTKDEGRGGGKRDFEKAIKERRPGTKNPSLLPRMKKQGNIESKHRDIAGTMKKYYNQQRQNRSIDTINDLLERSEEIEYFNRVYMQYFKKVYTELSRVKISTLVFLDPDTGLEPEASKGKKYVTYDTIKYIYDTMEENSVIMTYQHGLFNLKHKKDTLREITLNIASIDDREIVFLFLAKNTSQIAAIQKCLKQYHERYSLRTRCG